MEEQRVWIRSMFQNASDEYRTIENGPAEFNYYRNKINNILQKLRGHVISYKDEKREKNFIIEDFIYSFIEGDSAEDIVFNPSIMGTLETDQIDLRGAIEIINGEVSEVYGAEPDEDLEITVYMDGKFVKSIVKKKDSGKLKTFYKYV